MDEEDISVQELEFDDQATPTPPVRVEEANENPLVCDAQKGEPRLEGNTQDAQFNAEKTWAQHFSYLSNFGRDFAAIKLEKPVPQGVLDPSPSEMVGDDKGDKQKTGEVKGGMKGAPVQKGGDGSGLLEVGNSREESMAGRAQIRPHGQ